MHTDIDQALQDPTRSSQDIANDALAGWHAARYGMPMDDTQSEAWVAGWQLWHETH